MTSLSSVFLVHTNCSSSLKEKLPTKQIFNLFKVHPQPALHCPHIHLVAIQLLVVGIEQLCQPSIVSGVLFWVQWQLNKVIYFYIVFDGLALGERGG